MDDDIAKEFWNFYGTKHGNKINVYQWNIHWARGTDDRDN